MPPLRRCHYRDLLTRLTEISLTMCSAADRIRLSIPTSAFSRALAEKGIFEGKHKSKRTSKENEHLLCTQ